MFRQHVLSRKSDGERPSRGQSVVEFALVLPILMVIVAGTLEVGNLLTFYNRVQLAAREGARFAAAGGSDVKSIIQQASNNSLDMDADFLTFWVIRPTIVAPSNNPDDWYWENAGSNPPWGVDEKCTYGDMCASGVNPITAQRALDDVRESRDLYQPGEIDGTTFAVVVVYYEVDTILNLPFWQATGTTGAGRVPIWAYGIMAQEVEDETVAMQQGGCSAYSLMIERNVLTGLREGQETGWVYLDDPTVGSVGGFTFLGWQYDHSQPADVMNHGVNSPGSMNFPGTSLSPDYGFIEYDANFGAGNTDDFDTSLHRDDWVIWNTASVADANQPLYQSSDSHLQTGRAIRVLIYDQGTASDPNPAWRQFGDYDPKWQFRVDDFAIVRVVDEQHGSINALKFEFVGWDTSCGYPEAEEAE